MQSLKSICLILLLFHFLHGEQPQASDARSDLYDQYVVHWQRASDINEHLPTIKKYAAGCSSVLELGVRDMVSTWALLEGLAESVSSDLSYIGVDLQPPNPTNYDLAKSLCDQIGISFDFILKNNVRVDPMPADLLFIDTFHTYVQLTYELETFSPLTRKYIIMHDTAPPWDVNDEPVYSGDFSEYPLSIDRTKHGTWSAVQDFLLGHPEWEIAEVHHNSYGLTVLQRK
jgi:hypothetical protein